MCYFVVVNLSTCDVKSICPLFLYRSTFMLYTYYCMVGQLWYQKMSKIQKIASKSKRNNQTIFRYIKLYLDIFSCLCKFIAKHFLWKRGFMLGTNLRQSLQTFFRGGFKRFCALNFICVLNDKTFPIRFILNYCCCFCKNLVFCVYICLFFPDNYTTSQMYSAKHDIEIFHLKCIILKRRGKF